MATPQENLARFQEIANRGLQDQLDPTNRTRFDEAMRRGLITGGAVQFVPEDLPITPEFGGQYEPVAPQPQPGLGQKAVGVAETGLALGTGATFGTVGHIIGFLEGLAKEMASGQFGSNEAAQRIQQEANRVAGEFTYTPQTQKGQEYTQAVGEALAPLQAFGPNVDIVSGAQYLQGSKPILSSYVTKKQKGQNINPAVERALAEQQAEVIPTTKQFGRKGEDFKSPYSFAGKEKPKYSEIRKSIENGDVEGVGWKFGPKNNIVKDPLQRDLVKNYGVNENLMVMKWNMAPEDRANAIRMLDIVENRVRKGSAAEDVIPRKVIGNNAMKRVKIVKQEQQKAVGDIKRAVDNDLAGKQFDITSDIAAFQDDLLDLGITVGDDGALNFTNSLVDKNRSTIRQFWRKLNINQTDGKWIHKLKQSLDKNINWNDPYQGPIDADVITAMKSLRGKINKKLRDESTNYAAANDRFKEAAQVVEPFYEIMGKRVKQSMGELFDAESMFIDDQVAQELRKTITNYDKAFPMREAMNNLEQVAVKFGGEFNDDLMTQVFVNNELERTFGSFVPGNAQGVIEAGGEIAGRNVLRKFGVVGDVAAGAIETGKEKLKWVPPSKEKLELIKKLKTYFKED